MKKCKVSNCEEKHHAKGYCQKHYDSFGRKRKTCKAKSCEREAIAKGYCYAHYARFQKTGSAQEDIPIRKFSKRGEGCIVNGYRRFKRNGEIIYEHREVMEKHLGRKLFPDEHVHHKDGNRLNNRIENLELWSSLQPYGQRVEDKLKWAKEIIKRYG